jgi:hypothetical protein
MAMMMLITSNKIIMGKFTVMGARRIRGLARNSGHGGGGRGNGRDRNSITLARECYWSRRPESVL